MSITDSLNTVQSTLNTLSSSINSLSANGTSSQDFAALLSQATTTISTSTTNPAIGKADYVSGRIGLNLKGGVPAEFVYFNEQGAVLRKSTFTAESLLKNSSEFGISLTDTQGIKQQLENANVGYKPYELYPGTGSDHGINFDDLIAGGLGTAYDWRKDDNAAQKDQVLIGTAAQGQATRILQEAQALSDRLGLVKNTAVTTELGIDPVRMTSLLDGAAQTVSHVVYTGGTASWYPTAQAAQQAQAALGGTTLDLSDVPVPDVYLQQAQAELNQSTSTINNAAIIANIVSSNTAPSTDSTPASEESNSETDTTLATSNTGASSTTTTTNTAQTQPAVVERTLQDQLNDMVSSLTNGNSISMSSYLNTYNQMQALLARMQSLQQS